MLSDIATEELSHLKIIRSTVAMLNRAAKGALAEAVDAQAGLYRKLTAPATTAISRRCCLAQAPR